MSFYVRVNNRRPDPLPGLDFTLDMDKHEIQCICSTFFEHIKENRVLQPENVGLFYLKQYISDFHIFRSLRCPVHHCGFKHAELKDFGVSGSIDGAVALTFLLIYLKKGISSSRQLWEEHFQIGKYFTTIWEAFWRREPAENWEVIAWVGWGRVMVSVYTEV